VDECESADMVVCVVIGRVEECVLLISDDVEGFDEADVLSLLYCLVDDGKPLDSEGLSEVDVDCRLGWLDVIVMLEFRWIGSLERMFLVLVVKCSGLELLDSVKVSEVVDMLGSVDPTIDSDLPWLVEGSSVILPLCPFVSIALVDLLPYVEGDTELDDSVVWIGLISLVTVSWAIVVRLLCAVVPTSKPDVSVFNTVTFVSEGYTDDDEDSVLNVWVVKSWVIGKVDIRDWFLLEVAEVVGSKDATAVSRTMSVIGVVNGVVLPSWFSFVIKGVGDIVVFGPLSFDVVTSLSSDIVEGSIDTTVVKAISEVVFIWSFALEMDILNAITEVSVVGEVKDVVMFGSFAMELEGGGSVAATEEIRDVSVCGEVGMVGLHRSDSTEVLEGGLAVAIDDNTDVLVGGVFSVVELLATISLSVFPGGSDVVLEGTIGA
jgi:hypothetical protein